jgi:ankyrin repeat protein
MANPTRQFITAAKRGDLRSLESLLASDPSLIGARDSDGSTALHCAAWKGHEGVVEWLLGAGADVRVHNENDHWGTTALHAAAHANHARIAERLLEAGADIDARDREGRTPLDHTKFHNARAAARALMESPSR